MSSSSSAVCDVSDFSGLGSRSKPWDVLIAGAGVGGAALALALVSRFGLRVRVLDRRGGPGNINRGDSLLPAVTAALQSWGALPALRSAGARPVAKMQVFHPVHGKLLEAPLSTPDLDGDGPHAAAPYLVLAHPEIERVLVQTATTRRENRGRAQVTYHCRLQGLLRDGGDGGRVIGAHVQDEHGEESVYARLVVGADGSSSIVRSLLGLSLPTTPYDHSYYILECQRPPNRPGIDGYEDAMRIELSPEGGILVVPQGRDRLGLGVLVQARDTDLFRAGPLSEKLAAIARRSPLLSGLGKPGGLTAFPKGAHLYALQRGHARTYARDGAVLIGDALHVTNPTAGQGMTMAIEDAAALARRVGPVLEAERAGPFLRSHDLDRAIVDYQRERWPRNEAQIRWSHWLSRFYAWDGALGDAVHTQLFRFGGSSLGRLVQQRIWSRLATRKAAPPAPAWSAP